MKRALLSLSILMFGCTSSDPPKKDAKAGSKVEAKAKAGEGAKVAAADGKPKAHADTGGGAQAVAAASPLHEPAKATETAPDKYKVKFETTKGEFTVEVHRDWAPIGADRFFNLVKLGFYNDVAFFRAIDGFMVQFGMNGDPAVTRAWKQAKMTDDPVKESNTPGKITFATSGKDSRTTQVFINYGNNANLDGMGFAPFGEVVEGMDVVKNLHTGYGEGAPRGKGPSQSGIDTRGNAYLRKDFPNLDWVKQASVVEG